MFSLSRSIACCFGLALTLSGRIAEPLSAQAPAQDTAHKKGTMQMPMNMPMGKKPQKKKTPRTAAGMKPPARRATTKTGEKSAPVGTAAKKSVAHKSMLMPMGAEAHHAPEKAREMPMADTTRAMHGDSARQEMSGMKMQSARAKTDSMELPGTTAMPGMAMSSKSADSTHMQMPGMKTHSAEDMMIGPAGVSMERMGSGTTWIPDAVTLPSRRLMFGDWMLMAHGFVFAQYDKQSGDRGDDQFGSLNWGMLMATRDLAGGRLQARTMLSLDPFTVTGYGYPLLLQTGESYKGQPLHDRQHPHDFWMELGALYQHEINKGLAWSVYAAPSGEPALGPVAFMHRPSAMDNPAAPLGHHWQDATHVSFGVLTGGVYSRKWQLETSVFNGLEPDDNRWNFDPIKLDSYSARLTVNPTPHWSLAGGYGYLKRPEQLNPDESMHRVTASALHGTRLGSDGQWASTFIWGANKHSTQPGWSNSLLAESEAILDKQNTLFGRAEWVQKSAEDLAVVNPVVAGGGVVLPGFPASQRFNVGALQLGYIGELARTHWATIGLGAAGTLNFVPALLEPYYGSRNPTGTFIFLRLRPFHKPRSTMRMNDMGGMKMEGDRE
jgi:hypothetical protein